MAFYCLVDDAAMAEAPIGDDGNPVTLHRKLTIGAAPTTLGLATGGGIPYYTDQGGRRIYPRCVYLMTVTPDVSAWVSFDSQAPDVTGMGIPIPNMTPMSVPFPGGIGRDLVKIVGSTSGVVVSATYQF